LPATGTDQSNRSSEPGRRAGRNADRASLRHRRGVAAETGHHQPDRIVSVYGAAGGPQRKTLARRRSTAALDRHRALGSRKKVPAHQRRSRKPVAKGKAESVSHSAEGGSDSRSRLNRGCYWSNEMRIVSPRASWRGIFSRKTEIVTRKEKRSLLRSLTGQEKKLYSAEHRESLQSTKTRTSSEHAVATAVSLAAQRGFAERTKFHVANARVESCGPAVKTNWLLPGLSF